jgi:hypothetical protein
MRKVRIAEIGNCAVAASRATPTPHLASPLVAVVPP